MGSAWLDHVKAEMKAHPGLKLKEVLKIAKKSYKKSDNKVAEKKSTRKARKPRKSRKSKKSKKGKKKKNLEVMA